MCLMLIHTSVTTKMTSAKSRNDNIISLHTNEFLFFFVNDVFSLSKQNLRETIFASCTQTNKLGNNIIIHLQYYKYVVIKLFN